MATVREFDGDGDRVEFAPGVLEAVGGDTPVTVVALVKLDTDDWRTIVSFEAPGADERVGLQVNADADVLGLVVPFGFDLISAVVSAPAGQWLLVGMQRDGGENQMIRLHVCDVATGMWVHEDTATRSDPGAIGPSGRIQIGEMSDFGEFLAGRLAVVGVWLDTFSDQALEGAGLHTALRNWLNLGGGGPASLLVFNQPTTADPVVDVVDSGVEQTSIVGTTAVEDQDLDFDYSLGGGGTREARSWAAPAASQADRVGSGTREAQSWAAPAASQADRVGSGTREAQSWTAPAASQADRVGSGTREARSWAAPAASQAEVITRSVRDARSWSAPAASQADRAGSGTREARSWAAPAASWAEATESGEPDRPITPFPFPPGPITPFPFPPGPITPFPFPPRPVTPSPFELQPVRSFKEVGRGCP